MPSVFGFAAATQQNPAVVVDQMTTARNLPSARSLIWMMPGRTGGDIIATRQDEVRPRLPSAADLKFLSVWPRARHRNFKSQNRTRFMDLLVHH